MLAIEINKHAIATEIIFPKRYCMIKQREQRLA